MATELETTPETEPAARRTRPKRAVVAVVCVAALIGAGWLAIAASADGPMQLGATDGSWAGNCWADPDATPQALFGSVFRVDGDSPIVIDEIRLVDAENLRLDKSYVVPIIDGEGGIGAWEYPPQNDLPGWERAKDAIGAEVGAGRYTTLAVVVERPDPSRSGRTDHLRVSYHVGARVFTEEGTTTFELGGDCKDPE